VAELGDGSRYWKSVALMVIGGTARHFVRHPAAARDGGRPGVALPESVAAAEIHKAGQQGAKAAKILFANMGFGGLMYFLGAGQLFWYTKNVLVNIPQMAKGCALGRGTNPYAGDRRNVAVHFACVSPAYLGVGYIIGPRLASLNFAGGVAGLGIAGSAPNLLSWANICHRCRRRKPGRLLGRHRVQRVVFDRASDRGRWHAGRGRVTRCSSMRKQLMRSG
jgi:hypothetical protein